MKTERYRTNDTALIEALRRREEKLPAMSADFADRVLRQLEQQNAAKIRQASNKRRRHLHYPIAAAAVLLALMAVAWWTYGGNTDEIPATQHTEKPVAQATILQGTGMETISHSPTAHSAPIVAKPRTMHTRSSIVPNDEPQAATQLTPTQASEETRDAEVEIRNSEFGIRNSESRIVNIPARNRQLRQVIYAALPTDEQLSSTTANTTEL